MRNVPVAIWLIVALLGAIWALPGCQPEQEQASPTEEVAPGPEDELEEAPTDEGEAPEATDQEDPEAPDESADAAAGEPDEEISADEAEAALDVQVDYDRAYREGDFQPLRTVIQLGNARQKAKVRSTLEDLLLNSNVASTRATAAGVLSVAPEGSEQALTRAALNDPEKLVRMQAIDTLAKAPASPELLSALAMAQGAEDPEVRRGALMAEMEMRLASMQPGDDTNWLARLLGRSRDDASAQLQIKLVQRGEAALSAAIDVLRNASDEDARAGAACAIALICAGTNPKQEQFAEFSRAIMKEGLAAPEPANLDGLRPLENALADDPSWKVRAISAQGLGYLGQESSAAILGEALRDSEEEVRWWAALALETVPAEAAVGELAAAATRDESRRVRAAAVRALGWVESEEATLPLIRATADESSAVRQAAAEELARIESPAGRQALVRLFNDPSEDVRWAAVVAAGKLRDEDTVPALIEAMRDPSAMVANAAERALQRMGKAERRFGLESET